MRSMATTVPQAGFTLTEVLVAIVVLAIGLLGLAGLQAVGLRGNHGAYLKTQATLAAQDIIERVVSVPYNHNDIIDTNVNGLAGLDDEGNGTAFGVARGIFYAIDQGVERCRGMFTIRQLAQRPAKVLEAGELHLQRPIGFEKGPHLMCLGGVEIPVEVSTEAFD